VILTPSTDYDGLMVTFIQLLFNPSVPFLRNAVLAAFLASIAIGLVGSFVVVRKISYSVGAITHASLMGVGIAFFLNLSAVYSQLAITLTAILFGVLIALLSEKTVSYYRYDRLLSIVWALGAAVGILLISLTPGYVSAESYLFGNILFFSTHELLILTVVDIILVIVFSLCYRRFTALSFDEEYLWLRGVSVRRYRVLFFSLVALCMSILASYIGIILLLALMTVPVATVRMFSGILRIVILRSSVLTAFYIISGIYISSIFDLPASSIIVLLAILGYILLFVYIAIRQRMSKIQ